MDVAAWLVADPQLEDGTVRARVVQAVQDSYQLKVERIGPELMRHIERDVVLRQLDTHWRDHLAAMDYLRQGIHLRGYAQKDYRYEYKREAFELFTAMLGRVKYDVAAQMSKLEVRTQEQIDREEAERRERLMRALQAQHAEVPATLTQDLPADAEAAGAAGAAPGALGVEGAAAPRSCAGIARSGATSRARAGRDASTSNVTACWSRRKTHDTRGRRGDL